jgi:two-component sensor histidine kinase
VRDVTEVRKRDRLLLTKDATIREIHHRVKNNLQTISSLLRLQGRRLTSDEAKAAIAESVRRIRTIALVHETLSREPGDDVAFLEIVRPLLRLAEEGLQSVDRPVRFTVQGDGGRLPSTVATPLSVVLTELLQNAVDHGFPEGSSGGDVVVVLSNADDRLDIRVINDGRPLDPGFQLNQATGLGLSIVRTLVTTELDGTIAMRPGEPEDFVAAGLGDQPRGAGTVVDLSVPAAGHATADLPTLFLAGAAPDARVLVGLDGVLQAVVAHRALTAHLLGAVDLHERVPRGADREEQVGVGVAADRVLPPGVVSTAENKARCRDAHFNTLRCGSSERESTFGCTVGNNRMRGKGPKRCAR